MFFLPDEPLWCLSEREFRVVPLDRGGDNFHRDVYWNAVKDKLRPAGFAVDPVNSHMVVEGLVEWREVRLVFGASGCQTGVKNQVVALYEVTTGEIVAVELCVLLKDLVCQSKTLGDGDCWFGWQLEDDLLFCLWELP